MIKKGKLWLSLLLIGYTEVQSSDIIQYFEYPTTGELTQTMKEYYNQNGFLIFNNYLTLEESNKLIVEGDRLIDEFNPTTDTVEIFAADSLENASKKGEYFRKSADDISFFYEEKAFEGGCQVVQKSEAINKIGHALGELNFQFRSATFRQSISILAEQLGVQDPRLNQSMLICKPKKIGGMVYPHQDSTFLYSEPDTTTAFWMPLEEATIENACLYAIPGSHKWPLLTRYVRKADGQGFGFTNLEGKDLEQSEIMELMSSWPKESFVSLPMQAGSLIVFHGKLVHGSGPNISDKSRKAYTFHLISGESEYSKDNWLQREQFSRLIGEDIS